MKSADDQKPYQRKTNTTGSKPSFISPKLQEALQMYKRYKEKIEAEENKHNNHSFNNKSGDKKFGDNKNGGKQWKNNRFNKKKNFKKKPKRKGKPGKRYYSDRQVMKAHFGGSSKITDNMVAAFKKIVEIVGCRACAIIYMKVMLITKMYKRAEFKHICDFRYSQLPHLPYDVFGISMKFLVENKYLLIQKMKDTIVIQVMKGNGKKIKHEEWKKAWYADPAGQKLLELKKKKKEEAEKKEALEKASNQEQQNSTTSGTNIPSGTDKTKGKSENPEVAEQKKKRGRPKKVTQ